MAEVTVLHCADAHIGACENFLGERARSRQSETLITFEKTVDFALQNNIQLFLIAGDLFDSSAPDSALVSQVNRKIESASGIRFVYAAGNHDPLNINSPYALGNLPENLYVLGTKDSVFTFDDIKARVYGRSFKEVYDNGEAEFSLTPPDDEYVNIMCIHGELTSGTSSNYNPITREFIKNSGMDYIALGHIHRRTDIGKLGRTAFAYCGCIEGQGFDETGEKGFYTGTVSKEGANLIFTPIAIREHIRETVDISDCTSSAEAANAVSAHLLRAYGDGYTKNLYRIELTGSVPENSLISTREVAARLENTVYYAKVKNRTSFKIDLLTLSHEPTLRGVFVKKMLARIAAADDEEKSVCERALKIGLKAFDSEVTFDEDQ